MKPPKWHYLVSSVLLTCIMLSCINCAGMRPLVQSQTSLPEDARQVTEDLLIAFQQHDLATVYVLLRNRDGSEFDQDDKHTMEINLKQARGFANFERWTVEAVTAINPTRYQLKVRLHYANSGYIDHQLIVELINGEWKVTTFYQLLK